MYSAGFAAFLEYAHTLFLVFVFPIKMKQTIFLFCYLLLENKKLHRKSTL